MLLFCFLSKHCFYIVIPRYKMEMWCRFLTLTPNKWLLHEIRRKKINPPLHYKFQQQHRPFISVTSPAGRAGHHPPSLPLPGYNPPPHHPFLLPTWESATAEGLLALYTNEKTMTQHWGMVSQTTTTSTPVLPQPSSASPFLHFTAHSSQLVKTLKAKAAAAASSWTGVFSFLWKMRSTMRVCAHKSAQSLH